MIEFVRLFFSDAGTFVGSVIVIGALSAFVLFAYKLGKDINLW